MKTFKKKICIHCILYQSIDFIQNSLNSLVVHQAKKKILSFINFHVKYLQKLYNTKFYYYIV